MQRPILLFEDKLGISEGYEGIWNMLLVKAGLQGVQIYRRNAHRGFGNKFRLLTQKGNRTQPGFNEDPAVQKILTQWMVAQIDVLQPALCLCSDPALFYSFNADWNQATSDNLRGGHYIAHRKHFVILFGMSAWYANKREKDIARLNDGFTDEKEWEEEHGGDETDTEMTQIWVEPLSVPYGRFTLEMDLKKTNRLYRRILEGSLK